MLTFVIVVVMALVVAVQIWFRINVEECDWSQRDEELLEQIEFDLFNSEATNPVTASCQMSLPDWLTVDYRPATPAGLPPNWYERDRVGQWTAGHRYDSKARGRWICYRSSADEHRFTEVVVFSSGRLRAELSMRREPCRFSTTSDDVLCEQDLDSPAVRCIGP